MIGCTITKMEVVAMRLKSHPIFTRVLLGRIFFPNGMMRGDQP
jgi:hypothetical protein